MPSLIPIGPKLLALEGHIHGLPQSSFYDIDYLTMTVRPNYIINLVHVLQSKAA